MGDTAANAARIAPLALPVLLGFLAARLRLVRDVDGAIAGLNGFALYFAFPALIAGGLLDSQFTVPREVGFWLAVPLTHAFAIGWAWAVARLAGRPDHAGTLALVGLFGNIAYLGLPYAIAVFGESAAGPCALIVALHVAGSMAFGPLLLARWSGAEGGTVSWRRLVGQPLLWAPAFGLVARTLPDDATGALAAVLTPLGRGAAPAALFMLGLYLYQNRTALRPGAPGVLLHVATRLVVVPAAAAAVAVGLVALGMLQPEHAAMTVVLAAMPSAITTFAFAQEFAIGRERVAGAIVQSTVLALVTLPIVASLALAW